MASQQTPNYRLSRWAGTDRILVEEFNDNWDKIDGAMLGKLGKVEKIGVVQNKISNNAASSIDLSNIDWGSYQAVILAAPDYVDAAYKFSFSAEGTSSTAATAPPQRAALARSTPRPIFLYSCRWGTAAERSR